MSHRILLIDDELHKSLALFAGREYAWRVTENIKSQIDRVRFLTYDMAKPTAQIITEHEAIVDAIEAGDPDAADPVCPKSPHHEHVAAAIEQADTAAPSTRPLIFRDPKESRRLTGQD